MIRKDAKIFISAVLAIGLVASGTTVANAYDGTRACAASSVPVTFSYTPLNAGQPNMHRHVNLSNTSQVFTDIKWEGGNKTTPSPYRQIGFQLSGSFKDSWCS